MSLLSHIPLMVGLVLLVGAAAIIWRRPSENNPLTVMFLAGVALIFLSDQRIQNLKFGTSGLEVTREKFVEAQQDVGEQMAAIRAEIEKQKQILDQHQRLIDTRAAAPGTVARPNAAGGGSGAAGTGGGAAAGGGGGATAGSAGGNVAAPVVAEVKQIEKKFSQNSQYLILVFFRAGQKTAAEALSAKLVEQGYKSSPIGTDLTEISIPGIDPRTGTIVIARARQVPAQLATDIAAVAKGIATQYKLSEPTVNNDEWPFRRGHIQVYMY